MSERITPYKDGGRVDERIDEIVLHNLNSVHIEMMDGGTAWMRLGNEVFWINAIKGKLVIRWSETREGYQEKRDAPSG